MSTKRFKAEPVVTLLRQISGGGRGIRTPEPLSRLTVFKAAGFNHLPIPPHASQAGVRPASQFQLFRMPSNYSRFGQRTNDTVVPAGSLSRPCRPSRPGLDLCATPQQLRTIGGICSANRPQIAD